MCNTPEAFLSLRSHFICSHALLCVSHWVLGIGDRHLSNFMINVETGGMIGIDFGHAFGSATQVSHKVQDRFRKDLFLYICISMVSIWRGTDAFVHPICPQFLAVPELMPFRLTQQFVNLMQPLRESGLIQSVMVHSLRAYSADQDLLLNTMDVFVKEPLLDWKVIF